MHLHVYVQSSEPFYENDSNSAVYSKLLNRLYAWIEETKPFSTSYIYSNLERTAPRVNEGVIDHHQFSAGPLDAW